jgi:lipid-binding SYLF domain-containing protein
MRTPSKTALLFIAALMLSGTAVRADPYGDTIALFKNAGQSASFFKRSYGYAAFPTIGKGGFVVGGAHGSGRVYQQGKYLGDTSMTQVSVGFQAGGEAYSQIIFFQDQRALQEFTSGHFEFGADVGVVVITAAATGELNTGGSNASASGGQKDAAVAGAYNKGIAVFAIQKGGAMFEASVAGQKFSYKPKPVT